MDRLEQIALEYGLCKCDEIYTDRGLTAPDCPWHAFAVQEAMEAYATEVARHNLERAAEKAKVLVSNGESTVDVKSWTLEDGIRFSPDYRRITSLEIELI